MRITDSGIKESVIEEWKYDVVEEIYDGDLKYDPSQPTECFPELPL